LWTVIRRDAFGSLLDDRRFVGFAAFGLHVELVDEGPEGRRAALELARHVNEPLRVGERLLTGRPQGDPGMGAHHVQQRRDRLGNRTAIARDMQAAQQVEGIRHL